MAKPFGEPKASAEPKSTRMTRSQAVSKPTVDYKEEFGDEVETMDVDIVLEAMKPYNPLPTRMNYRRGALDPQETDVVTQEKSKEHKQMEANEDDMGDKPKTNPKAANKNKTPVAQIPTRRTRSQSVLRRTGTMDMDESNKSSESEEHPTSVKTAEPETEAEEDTKPAPRGRGRPRKFTATEENVKANEKEAQPKPAKNARFAAALAAVQSTAGELKDTINNLQKRNDKARVEQKEETNKFPYDKMKPRTRFQKSQIKTEEKGNSSLDEDFAALELGAKTLHKKTLSKDEQIEIDNAIFPLLSDSDEAGKEEATYVQAFRDVEGLSEAISCFESIRGLVECAALNKDDLEEMGKLAEIGMENVKAYLGMVEK
jgi:hypothetical protein